MYEKVTATAMKLDISIQMAVEQVLAQKSKERAIWTTQAANINEYASVNAAEPGDSSGRTLRFFFCKKQISEFFSPKF